jgi:hypothetical protein
MRSSPTILYPSTYVIDTLYWLVGGRPLAPSTWQNIHEINDMPYDPKMDGKEERERERGERERGRERGGRERIPRRGQDKRDLLSTERFENPR